MTTRIICFAGRKGGTGKTISCVNVARWLASHGRRVLLLDIDPQFNATTALGRGSWPARPKWPG